MCIPWYFPPLSGDERLCTPFEVQDFNRDIESMDDDECMVCNLLYCGVNE